MAEVDPHSPAQFRSMDEGTQADRDTAFDPDYDHAPLSFFEPLVMRLFERPRASAYARAIAESG